MLAILLVLGVCFWIVVGAARIIIGWVLPRPTVAAIDRAFHLVMTTFLKLIVLGLAAGIIWLVYSAATAAPH